MSRAVEADRPSPDERTLAVLAWDQPLVVGDGMVHASSLTRTCGTLILGGWDGPEVPAEFLEALTRGERGGGIAFRRNLPTLAAAQAQCVALHAAAPRGLPPLLAIDEEGGRVSRLPAPFRKLPPMRRFGERDDPTLTERAGAAVGAVLAALGFNLNFAPILDVDSNPANPIIGDRAFAADPERVSRHALAFARGLESASVLACGKHFPGHGDTHLDSHLDLPEVGHSRARVEAVELAPFRAAAAAGLATLMTAHVVFTALDPGVPATLSRRIVTDLLRGELGYQGLVFSDDLEMRALADRMPIETSAVGAIAAGCDCLLVCHSLELQDRAFRALVARATEDTEFRARCEDAAERCFVARRRCATRETAPREPLGAALTEVIAVGDELGNA